MLLAGRLFQSMNAFEEVGYRSRLAIYFWEVHVDFLIPWSNAVFTSTCYGRHPLRAAIAVRIQKESNRSTRAKVSS